MYRKNFKSSTSFSIGAKVGGKWTCDYSGSLVWWDDQQQVIGSCQQISCMEGPNLLLPFFGQDSFFNVLDSFHFTIQNYVVSYCFWKQWSERQAFSGSGLKMRALCIGASPGSSEEEEECLPVRQFILV